MLGAVGAGGCWLLVAGPVEPLEGAICVFWIWVLRGKGAMERLGWQPVPFSMGTADPCLVLLVS